MRATLCGFLFAVLFCAGDAQVATVTNGTIQGFVQNETNCFLGIPFAQAPIGGLRFQNPEPFGKWRSPLDGTQFKPQCIQSNFQLLQAASPAMSEDCLYLNVFTPLLSTEADLAVMVFIHGGGYITGGAAEISIDGIVKNFAARGVVVVTIQYRLNVFGFFTTNTGDFPPNIAMLDQVAALRWVKAEIKNFGGDPNHITIFGESAGSFSTSLHTYSPLSRGLFNQAILQSGTAYDPWALDGNQNQFPAMSRTVAVGTGCIDANSWTLGNFTSMKSCLRSLPWQTILNVSDSIATNLELGYWAPTVGTIDGFMPNWPRNLIGARKNRMSVMIGNMHDEYFLWYYFGLITHTLTFNAFTPDAFASTAGVLGGYYGKYKTEVQSALEAAYKPQNAKPTDYVTWFNSSVQMKSAWSFFAGAAKEAQAFHDNNDVVYAYSFDYGPTSFPFPKFNGKQVTAAFHALDYFLEFNTGMGGWTKDETDKTVADTFSKALTNFAKTGNPNQPAALNVPWTPHTIANQEFYSINAVSTMMNGFQAKANQVWNVQIPKITGNPGPTLPPGTTPVPEGACLRVPCQNGGTCIPIQGTSYRCNCTSGWTGEQCQFQTCRLTIANQGAYVLNAAYTGLTGRKDVYLTTGNSATFIAPLSSQLELKAVLGRTATCSVTPSLCDSTVTCGGTTYAGFSCTGCHSSVVKER